MINLPTGVEINSLIDNLKCFSWEASEVLLHYAQILRNSNNKFSILKNDNEDDPVTLADLKVNEIIIKNMNEKYKNIKIERVILPSFDMYLKNNNNRFQKSSSWFIISLIHVILSFTLERSLTISQST